MKKKILALILVLCVSIAVLVACASNEADSNISHDIVHDEVVDVQANSYDEIELVTIMSDYIIYDSIYSLSNSATDVVRGEVLESRVERINTTLSRAEAKDDAARRLGREFTEDEVRYWFPDYLGNGQWRGSEHENHYVISTIYSIRVLEVFQGTYQVDDIIEVRQLGGAYENAHVNYHGAINFETNNDLVIFFHSWSHIGRSSVLLNPYQSVYFFPAPEGRTGTLSLDTEIESITANMFELEITINDLLQLSDTHDFTMTRSGEWEPTYAPPAERQERAEVPVHDDIWDLFDAQTGEFRDVNFHEHDQLPLPSPHQVPSHQTAHTPRQPTPPPQGEIVVTCVYPPPSPSPSME